MKIRAQIAMILNLDKCLGCHTCSVTCKNVWTSRQGVEYAWFNNVETKPGVGYPNNWEDQEEYKGGWELKGDKLQPKSGNKLFSLAKIFTNPNQPTLDDYYEPFTFDYDPLHSKKKLKTSPTARPKSIITGERMDKIEAGPNWEDSLGGEFSKRAADKNFNDVQKEIYAEFENSFSVYLPRLCEHCLNPTCVASCPSGAIYKREDDGVVLIDQSRCRGWRQCISACPYKKIYFNWETKKSEKCTLCYPRLEAGEATLCSESCVGRIRYLGVILYDADKIADAASEKNEKDLYSSQLELFLDPDNPEVIKQAKLDGISDNWLDYARKSPIYKMAIDWKIAFPLHPEYRTMPMVWYVPPLSPIQSAAESGKIGMNGILPDVESLRIPNQYLANMFTAGDESHIVLSLKKLLAMRAYMRSKTVDKVENIDVLKEVGLTKQQVEEMYDTLALAHYEDRFVIPASEREKSEEAFGLKAACGFSDGNGCNIEGPRTGNLFGGFRSVD